MIRLESGSFEEKSGSVGGVEIRVIKWCDTKCVTLASTYAGVDPCSTVKRWDKKTKQTVEVPCPNAVIQYNSFMGGVNLLDGLVAYYRIRIR